MKNVKLGGGFKYFLFSSLPGEMIQFDEHIFQIGLLQPPTRKPLPFSTMSHGTSQPPLRGAVCVSWVPLWKPSMLVKIGRSSAASVTLGLGHTCHKLVLSCCLYVVMQNRNRKCFLRRETDRKRIDRQLIHGRKEEWIQ